MATELHEERLDAVVRHLLASGARCIVDLGCGDGELLLRLGGYEQFDRIVGIDSNTAALCNARRSMGLGFSDGSHRLQVRYGSFDTYDSELAQFDAATLVETIEHVDPSRLSRVENAVFGRMRPDLVLLTTPNREYNMLHGLPPGRMRHPEHRFEWDRAQFQQWASGVAARCAYEVSFFGIGPWHPTLGSSTQMARFTTFGRAGHSAAARTRLEHDGAR